MKLGIDKFIQGEGEDGEVDGIAEVSVAGRVSMNLKFIEDGKAGYKVVLAVPAVAETLCEEAEKVGASLTGAIVTFAVSVADPPLPSLAVTKKLSLPL